MSVLSASSDATARPTQPGAGETRLVGRWLVVARASYLLIALTVVALNLLALPDIAASQVTPSVLRQLHQQDYSPALYEAIEVATSVISFLVYLALSLLVFWRRSEERMALFCAVMLVVFGGVAASPLDDVTSDSPMPQPLASIAALRVLVHLLLVVGQVSFVVFFYLFPSGRFVPRWTRWFALFALAYWIVEVFFRPQIFDQQGNLILVFWLVAIIAQVYRYRRVSTPVEREQTKWIVFGLAVAGVFILIPSLLQLLLPAFASSLYYSGSIIGSLLTGNLWVVAVLLIPTFIAIAILRTHLWDIDVIINRALVYGLLTGLLAAVYFGSVIAIQQIVRLVSGQRVEQNSLVLVLSTLLIAALFTPLRRRLQRFIDRRFYRSKYDAARTLERFAVTLRSEVELGALSDHLVAVVDETMRPAHVSLWIRQPRPRVATGASEAGNRSG